MGNGLVVNSNTALAVGGVSAATAIAAGYGHSCALSSTGVQCWGLNGNGQLGSGKWGLTRQTTLGSFDQPLQMNPLAALVLGLPASLSASGGDSGNPVQFSSVTPAICAVSGINGSLVTGSAVGSCTIAANQAGNANYNAALTLTQTFLITITAPGSPTLLRLVPGSGSMKVIFAVPDSNGGAVIRGYRAICTPQGGGTPVYHDGLTSPITITGLSNDVSYSCSVYAFNDAGNGAASGQLVKLVRPAVDLTPVLMLLLGD